MISDDTIQEAVRRLVDLASPVRVLLFGSYARGDARGDSDLDFLVVERDVRNPRREAVRLHDAIRPLRIPADILVVKQATFDEWADVPGTVIHRAKTEGRACYASE